MLRKLGLFGVASRNVRRLKRALRRALRVPTGGTPPAPEPAPPSLTFGEALLLARSVPGDSEDAALERLYHLAATLPSVVCIHPTSRNAQAALMLACGGARVAWLGDGSAFCGAAAPGLTTPAPDLGSFLSASGLPRRTALLIDANAGPEGLRLLTGRLAPETVLLVTGPLPKAGWAEDPPTTEGVEGLAVFRSLPRAWHDLAHTEPGYYERSPWTSPPRPLALPERMPSGRPWPRISVVTASFNQARYLEETLLSVLRQDYPDLEYIVVDGGSTDRSRRILERYRSRLAHCIVEKDEGQAHALNKGFALATGEILAWLNSDDRYPAGALWRAALAFDTFGADIVAGGCRLVQDDDEETLRVHHSSLPVGRVVPLPLERILDLDGSWLLGDFFFQPEVFWTRDIWRRSGGRVEQGLFYTMDYDLWARMAHAGGRVVQVPDTLAVYRMHEKQKTGGGHRPYLPELRQVAGQLRRQWRIP